VVASRPSGFGNGLFGQPQGVFRGNTVGPAFRQLGGGELSALQPTRDLLLQLM
jgi:hypothetical protein